LFRCNGRSRTADRPRYPGETPFRRCRGLLEGPSPGSPPGGALLFHLISKLYERASLIVTTNLSFGEWSSNYEQKRGH
jgi:hypothetical protein